jgi:hypothetical protein
MRRGHDPRRLGELIDRGHCRLDAVLGMKEKDGPAHPAFDHIDPRAFYNERTGCDLSCRKHPLSRTFQS